MEIDANLQKINYFAKILSAITIKFNQLEANYKFKTLKRIIILFLCNLLKIDANFEYSITPKNLNIIMIKFIRIECKLLNNKLP